MGALGQVGLRHLPLKDLVAPSEWRCIDVLSDLHLSEATPATWAALQQYLSRSPAQALFILGDLVDVWVGDDQTIRPFDAELWGALSAFAEHRFLGFMAGNRDFLVSDTFLHERGIQPLADPCRLTLLDQTVLLSHGDAWCLADHDYQAFRAQVRSEVWQSAFLARSFEERWAVGQAIRAQSRSRKDQVADSHLWADVDGEIARAALQTAGARLLVHGHTHRPGREDWGASAREVLSDWDLEPGTATPRAEVLRWQDGQWRRIRVAGAPP